MRIITRGGHDWTHRFPAIKQSDVFDAILEEIGNLQEAYDRDPDPAEDHPGAEAEEPSNEWPGALP